MSEKSDARREVTSNDLATLDRAISAHEQLGGFLHTTRRVLKNGQRYLDDLKQQTETAQAELAKAYKEFSDKQQQIAAINTEIKLEQRTLDGYSRSIGKITGAAA
jgi:hypothetical protein